MQTQVIVSIFSGFLKSDLCNIQILLNLYIELGILIKFKSLVQITNCPRFSGGFNSVLKVIVPLWDTLHFRKI